MPTVLIVDDDRSFLASLVDGLSGEEYSVLVAGNGLEALDMLRRLPIDLVVTDVKMPEMDGVALVGELLNLEGIVPCVVMTAFATPELERTLQRLRPITIINKPVDLPSLRNLIRDILANRHDGGALRGVTLPSFLQLLALEKKTCVVKASGEAGTGLLFFELGELVDASTAHQEGANACFEILSWADVEINIGPGTPGSRRRSVDRPLEELLLGAMTRQDEMVMNRKAGQSAGRKGTTMAIDTSLEELKGIKGYIASGIMTFTGEPLASHSTNARVNLEAVGAIFNDIFRNAHEACGKIGLEAARVMTLQTPKGVIVMECSGVNSRAHLHFIAVLEETGNHALARMTLEKIVPKVVDEMAPAA